MPITPKFGKIVSNGVYIYRKSVGVLLLLVPRTEALASPDSQERATPKPTPICKYTTNTCMNPNYGITHNDGMSNITHLMDVHCCFDV